MLTEIKEKLKDIGEKLGELHSYLNVDKNTARLKELEVEISKSGFWDNQESARLVIQEMKSIKLIIGEYHETMAKFGEAKLLEELLSKEPDEDFIKEMGELLPGLEKSVNALEFKSLMSGEHDRNNAIVSIHSGAGGTESCDWASMLLRMYSMWAQRNGYGFEIIDILSGEGAGLKSACLIVAGAYSYGYLKSERGVHRLVRISPFDANKRRHTSFASVDVIPEFDEEIDIEINEADLKIDTYRSSGAGGQHVNVTDSAVRITHLPTGIVVQCQNERSQYKNKATAMKVLKARLYEQKMEEKKKELEEEYAKKKKIEWGSQIRSYVMHPYSMVKDHRTGYETSNVGKVMDGDLDSFIEAFLKWKAKE